MWILLLAACPTAEESCDEADKACDTGDTAPDDTDTDTRPDEPADTGIAALYYVGRFETEAGAYVDASFGYGFYGIAAEDWVCRVEGTLPYEGPAPDGCPDCDWAFDLGAPADAVATGPECAALGVTADGLDALFDYAWGFADTYVYEYNGTPLELGQALFIYVGESWSLTAFSYAGNAWTYEDAELLQVGRPAMETDGGYLYYYYER